MPDGCSDNSVPEKPAPPKSDSDEATLWSGPAISFPTEPPATQPAAGPPDAAPPNFGPYTLLRKLGEGGMGQVWLAEQTSPIQRQVAIKLIKAAGLDRSAIRRFESERQTLALMEHPAIAKVFDAGSTPDGEPYFVMEYVQGLPITTYCDEKQMAIADRLKLFLSVCQGVQHAHQRAIIHRDLKPSNILVTEVDGKPHPRIIDFGIAKIAAAESGTMITQLGVLVGTPGYISPEQADPTQDVDTRTDVYSLGVVLYELLAGTTPFDSTTWRERPFHEMLRQLQEDDPPRPSLRFDREKASSTAIAQNRGATETHQVFDALHGDLDWITLKALERNRDHRYATPAALADDIRRYLNDEVVLATPPTFAYRSRKFLKRHKLAAVSATLVAAALIALAVSMSIQTVRIRRERDRANREATAAKSVSDFLVGLFRVSDPSEARGNKVTAREILDKGRSEIETGLSTQPEVQARLMGTIGNVYTNLGLLKEARPLLEKAFNSSLARLGPTHPDTLQLRTEMADLTTLEGNYNEAEAQLQSLVAEERSVLGDKHPDTLHALSLLGGVLINEGRYRDAESLLTQTLAAKRETSDTSDTLTMNLMTNLAVVYDQTHQYDKAKDMFEQVVDLRTRTSGPDSPRTISDLQNLGYIYHELGKLLDSEKVFRDALERSLRVLGPNHPQTLQIQNNLANLLADENRSAEAEHLQREVLAKRIDILGPEHPQTLYSYNNLAGILVSEKKYDQATKIYWDVLTKERRVLGENHPDIGIVWYNLAALQAVQHNARMAFSYLKQAIDHGYTDAEFTAKDDSWASLRANPEYKSLLAEIQRRSQAMSSPQN